jgi:hypothetical protein
MEAADSDVDDPATQFGPVVRWDGDASVERAERRHRKLHACLGSVVEFHATAPLQHTHR